MDMHTVCAKKIIFPTCCEIFFQRLSILKQYFMCIFYIQVLLNYRV